MDEVYGVTNFQENLNGDIIRVFEKNKVATLDYDYGRTISVWGMSNLKLYASWRNVYVNNTTGWNEIEFDNPYTKRRIRGTGYNNIFIVGGYGLVEHFNGISWKEYPELGLQGGGYQAINIKDDLVVICGYNYGKGIVVIGKRK